MVISLVKETGLAIVAALDQVERYTSDSDAWASWHFVIILDQNPALNLIRKAVVCPLLFPSPCWLLAESLIRRWETLFLWGTSDENAAVRPTPAA